MAPEIVLSDSSNDVNFIFEIVKNGDLKQLLEHCDKSLIKSLEGLYDEHGNTPIHWASLKGHLNLLKYFIENGLQTTVKSNNGVGKQPIHWACANGHIAIVSLLLKNEVDIEALDNQATTPLLFACQFGHSSLVNFLINKGANLYQKDNFGNSALHWAAFRGHEELCSLLMYFGLDSNDTDNFGNNALHLAVINGSFWTFHTIANRLNTNLKTKNGNGESAYSLAVHFKRDLIIRSLKLRLGISSKFDKIRNLIQGDHGNNNYGIWFLVINIVLWGYPMYFYHALFTTWSKMMITHILFILGNGIMWYMFFRTKSSDPGWLSKNNPKYFALIHNNSYIEDEIQLIIENTQYKKGYSNLKPAIRLCHTCRCIRLVRSKHCQKCDRCVANFDHHCYFIGNCIGMKNRSYFFIFLSSMIFNGILSINISKEAMKLVRINWLYMLGYIQLCILTFIMCCLMTFVIIYISLNLTTNEIYNYKKYKYLRDPLTGKFKNPFDRGIIKNISEYFMCIPSVNYDELNIKNVNIM